MPISVKTVALFIVLRASVAIGVAQAPALERVSGSQISGTRLTSQDHAFSVSAPTGWVWFRMPVADRATATLHPELQSETFLAVDPTNRANRFLLSAVRDGRDTALSDEYMRGFGSGLERTSPKTGWHISEYRFGPATVPFAGAYQFSCVATSDAGAIKRRFGYLTGGNIKFHFEYSTADESESQQFRDFVASFKILASHGGT